VQHEIGYVIIIKKKTKERTHDNKKTPQKWFIAFLTRLRNTAVMSIELAGAAKPYYRNMTKMRWVSKSICCISNGIICTYIC